MAKVMELSLVIGASAVGALTGLAKVSQGLSKVKDNTEELAKTAKKLEDFDKSAKKMIELNKAYSEASEKLKMLRETQEKAGRSGSLFNEQIKKQERILNDLNRQKERQKHVFEAARSSIEKEGYSLKGYKENLEKVNKELKINKKLKEIQEKHEKQVAYLDKAQNYGDKLLKRGAVAGALTLAPIKIFMDVEESQADLRKMLGDEAQKYYGALREISDKSPLSQPEVFEIAGSLAQSGIKGDEIVEYTKRANQLKVAFDMTTQESGQFLAKTKEQLGLTKEELFSFTDTINYMSDNTASTAAQLAEFSQRVGSVAKTANLTKEANIAFGATLISMGTNTEVAATGIKQLYLELGKGADTKKKANALQFLGINGNTLARDMAKDAEGTILKVLEKIKNANAGDKIGLLTDIFGEQAANSVATLANNTDKLRENLAKSKSEMANGAVEREYASRINTLSNQLKMSWNKVKNALADLGLALAPSIKSLLQQATPLIEKMAQWIKQNPKLTEGLMKAIAVFALFNLSMGGTLKFGTPVVKNILSIVNVFQKLKAAGGLVSGFTKVFPIFTKIGPLLTNPWVLFGAVVIGVFVLLYNKSTWFRNGVNKAIKQIMPYVKELGKLLKDGIGKAITWVSNKMKQASPHMRNAWNALKPVLSFVGNRIKVAIVANIIKVIFVIKTMVNAFKFIVAVVKGVFKMISSEFKIRIAIWKGIFQIFIAFFTGKWNEIPGIVSKIWESVKSGISGFVDGAKTILKGLFDWFGSQWENIKKGGADLVKAINPLNWGKNYSGTNYWSGGLTTVAERGAELIKIPGQSPFIAQSEMLLNLPRGTQILNNSQTRNSLRDRVSSLKEKVSNLKNSNNSFGGDNITIQIIGGNNNPMDIAKEVRRELERLKNKKERTAFG